MRRRLRVLVLMHEDLVPPTALPADHRSRIYPWRTEHDVLSTLGRLGHEVRALGVRDDLGVIRDALADFAPDITFNVLEEFHGVTMYAQAVISFVELMRQPYTGCNPRGLGLAHDKLLTKKILTYHRIPTPRCTFYPRGERVRRHRRPQFPLIVKSSFEDASLGISQASVVYSEAKLEERVRFMHERIGTDAIAEEYVEGRELYVGVLGSERLRTLPVWEMTFNRWPDGAPRIATERVKWSKAYQDERGIRTGPALDLDPATQRRISRVARHVYRALELSAYARIDLRLGPDGTVWVIEANGTPDLARDEDFAASAAAAGIDYSELIQRILNLGLAWQPKWKEVEVEEPVG
ncbi:MAG: ATP-grasp domain-containing protein [Planctomycetota bacterium]